MDNFKQREPKRKILAISGSPRKGGNSDTIIDEIFKKIPGEAIETEIVYLRDLDFKSCIGCERCRKDKICTGLKDDMTEIYDKIIDASLIITVSPAHNYNVTALMKAFIDRMYCFYNFSDDSPRAWNSHMSGQNRKAVVIGIAEQVEMKDMGFTMDGMKLPLQALGYEIISELPVLRIFDRGFVRNDTNTMNSLKSIAEKLI